MNDCSFRRREVTTESGTGGCEREVVEGPATSAGLPPFRFSATHSSP